MAVSLHPPPLLNFPVVTGHASNDWSKYILYFGREASYSCPNLFWDRCDFLAYVINFFTSVHRDLRCY